MKLAKPTDQDLHDAAITGDWSRCAGAIPFDLMRPLFADQPPVPGLPEEPATAAYLALESRYLGKVPKHLLTRGVWDQLWSSPTYSGWIEVEFEHCALLGDFGTMEPVLYTEENACRAIDDYGNTCMHAAARHGKLREVPAQMMTLKAMLTRNERDTRPLELVRECDLDLVAELIQGALPGLQKKRAKWLMWKLEHDAPQLWLWVTKFSGLSRAATLGDL
jgi:hypothetical protein